MYFKAEIRKNTCINLIRSLIWNYILHDEYPQHRSSNVRKLAFEHMRHAFTLSDQNLLWVHFGQPRIQSSFILTTSACIKGSLGVRDSQKLPWDFQKSVPGSLGLSTFKDI